MKKHFFLTNSLADFLSLLKSTPYMERRALAMQEEGKPLDRDGLEYLKDFNQRVFLSKVSTGRIAA